MKKTKKPAAKTRGPTQKEVDELYFGFDPSIRKLAKAISSLVRKVIPDAQEEIGQRPPMVVHTYIPGTYKGAVLAVCPQKNYVNIQFLRGVELLKMDKDGLLEGTGKQGRHIKIRSAEQLKARSLPGLIRKASQLTSRID